MVVSYTNDVDLEGTDFCDFLFGNETERFFSGLTDAEVISDGFSLPPSTAFSLPSTLIPSDNIKVGVRINFKWHLRSVSTGGLINTYETFNVEQHSVNIIVECRLLYVAGASQEEKDKVEAVSKALDFAQLELNGQAYVASLEAQLESDGVPVDRYLIDVGVRVIKLGVQVVADSYPSLENAIVQTWPDGSVTLTVVSRTPTCDKSGFQFDGNVIEVPVEGLEQPGVVEQALDDAMAESAQKVDCDTFNLEYVHHRVGTLYQYPEFKTETEKKWFKIGKCKLFKYKAITKTYKRTTKRALYVSAASPKSIVNTIKKGLLDCMVESAIVIGLLALVTGGIALSAAAAAYTSAVTQCLAKKFGDLDRCIIHDVYLVTEKGEWKEI